MPYKQVFTRQYAADSFGNRSLGDAVVMLTGGRLSIRVASGSDDVIDLGTREVSLSTNVLLGDSPHNSAHTPDNRYRVDVETFDYDNTTEYWLVHTDQAQGKFKRAKLTSEYDVEAPSKPRVSVSPKGSYFLVDDSGTVRLYTAAHLGEAGTFQVAHKNTANQIIALAVSTDETLVAALCSWKDIVVYSVTDRRVVFVRQIYDQVGWYDAAPAHIVLAGNAEAIITIGTAQRPAAPPQLSVNVFKFTPLPAHVG